MDNYLKSFKSLKPNRSLKWKSSLGTVELELQFEGKTLDFTVNPVQATIIMHFQDQGFK